MQCIKHLNGNDFERSLRDFLKITVVIITICYFKFVRTRFIIIVASNLLSESWPRSGDKINFARLNAHFNAALDGTGVLNVIKSFFIVGKFLKQVTRSWCGCDKNTSTSDLVGVLI
jgi:hypothetical protein